MDRQIKNWDLKSILIKLAWCLIAAGLLILLWKIKYTLLPVFIAIILAYIFLPFQKRLEKGMPSAVASFLVLLVIILGIVTLVFFILPIFISQITKLFESIPGFIESLGSASKIEDQLRIIGINLDIKQIFLDQMSNFTSFLQSSAESIVTILSNAVNIFTIIALIPFFMYYFLKDRKLFSKEFTLLVPTKHRVTAKTMSAEINTSLRSYVKGQIIVSVLEGIFSVVGFLIIGLNYAVLLGVIMGLLNLIPYVGVLIGAIFALFVALITGVENIVPTLIVIVIVQQLEGVLAPKIVGNSIGMHPVYVLVTILVSGYLFGLVGMFLGIPVVMVGKIILSHIYNKFVSPIDT